jgi:hypothetical protein
MLDGYANDLIPPDDADRLKKLREFDILYTSAEEAFDNITQMMAQVFGAPMSFISLVDEDTVFYKSRTGPFGRDQVRREDSLCSLTILNDKPLVITDASAEQRLTTVLTWLLKAASASTPVHPSLQKKDTRLVRPVS